MVSTAPSDLVSAHQRCNGVRSPITETKGRSEMQVIGLCRFSYPAIGGFQVTHPSPEDRMKSLWAPERMASRFATFEAYTLPCIRAQTDGDFTFIIVIGDTMPRTYKSRLQDLVADVPQIVIREHAPGKHRRVMSGVINAERARGKSPCLQFRLDDDDAVALHFVAELRRRAGQALPVLSDHRSLAIDFNQGFVVHSGPDGISAAPVRERCWTPGLAVMLQPRTRLTVMNFNHSRIWERMPVLSFPGEDMMIRGHTEYNDSRQKSAARPVKTTLLDKDHEDYFRMAFNVDADEVRRLFSPAHQAAFTV